MCFKKAIFKYQNPINVFNLFNSFHNGLYDHDQMGSTMKPTIFNERVATALRNWHHTAKKHIKQNRAGSVTPLSSRPTTPSHHMSPVHLLRHYRSEVDSLQNSPRRSNFDTERWDTDSPSPSHHHQLHRLAIDGSTSHQHQIEFGQLDQHDEFANETGPVAQTTTTQQPQPGMQQEIKVAQRDFSFERPNV